MNNLLFSFTEISNKLVNTLNGTLGIWYVIILNAFGVIAILCKVTEYQMRRRNIVFILAIVAQILWMLYFVFYGDFLSAISCIITFISTLIFSQRENHQWAKSVWWLILFLAVQVAMVILTFKGLKDIFSALAGFLGIFAYYCVDMKKYRITSFFYSLAWLLNSIIKFYPLALASDLFSTISVSIGIYRYDIKKQPEPEKDKKTEQDKSCEQEQNSLEQ